ncbi:hypothetical protein [Amycolatopsis jejuensis]|uniref:hypothetical protein n=1 Tax=Amycolatopsis jejuensis TaxID=330084 RepID=UPI000A822023|nr:hypothetical protein [Amycolatopsis jejuensis]
MAFATKRDQRVLVAHRMRDGVDYGGRRYVEYAGAQYVVVRPEKAVAGGLSSVRGAAGS